MGKELKEYGLAFRSVMGNPKINLGARVLYGILITYRNMESNSCFPGSNLLCDLSGSSRQQVNIWLKELEAHKVIKRETRFNNLNGRRMRTIVIMDDNYEE